MPAHATSSGFRTHLDESAENHKEQINRLAREIGNRTLPTQGVDPCDLDSIESRAREILDHCAKLRWLTAPAPAKRRQGVR